jgi:hypothetical protein
MRKLKRRKRPQLFIGRHPARGLTGPSVSEGSVSLKATRKGVDCGGSGVVAAWGRQRRDVGEWCRRVHHDVVRQTVAQRSPPDEVGRRPRCPSGYLAAALDPVADDVVEVEGRQGEVVVGLSGVPDRSIGSPLGGVAVSPNGNTVYVANDGSDSVSVIDTGT